MSTPDFTRRREDWRFGPVVYQVFVDRFVPSGRLEQKAEHYRSPRVLRSWKDRPAVGHYLHEEHVTQQELEFWGGDLQSAATRLDYLKDLGVEVVYLNPIFSALTNHKYDTIDYHAIDPQYGSHDDLKYLVRESHERRMKVVLDGVFNHVGRRSVLFQDAGKRAFFDFSAEHPGGYRAWRDIRNLPELVVENPEVRKYLWDGAGSVVQRYLTEHGIDGWRLDVAPELGFHWLAELTRSAHQVRPGSVVLGECWNYPERWLEVLDGILNLHARRLILALLTGSMSVETAATALEMMIADSSMDGLLKSHLVLDNHDVPRLASELTNVETRRLAQVLQFTLPGSPVLYYGSELGMTGGHDPQNRAPMEWDRVSDDNPDLRTIKDLVRIRRENPALRIGEFRRLAADGCLAFLRTTDRSVETVVVVVNPTPKSMKCLIPIRDSRLMDSTVLDCALTHSETVLSCGMIEVALGPRSARIFRSRDRGGSKRYSMYKRMP